MIVIYNDDLSAYIDANKEYIKDFLNDMQIFINDETITEQAQSEIIEGYSELLNDVANFDKTTQYNKILCVASLGLWYGTKKAQRYFKDLKSALYFEDQNKLYFKNKNSTLTLQAVHHDGVNIFKFYKIVDGKRYAIKNKDFYRG